MIERELRIVETATGRVEHTVDVSGKSDSAVERIMRGMLINLNRDAYHIADSDDD